MIKRRETNNNMDFTKIRELLKGLVNDSLPTEEVEKIGAAVQELDNA